ncbi:hypothetical protein F7725_017615, partial [Dissostichus mawsoni]
MKITQTVQTEVFQRRQQQANHPTSLPSTQGLELLALRLGHSELQNLLWRSLLYLWGAQRPPQAIDRGVSVDHVVPQPGREPVEASGGRAARRGEAVRHRGVGPPTGRGRGPGDRPGAGLYRQTSHGFFHSTKVGRPPLVPLHWGSIQLMGYVPHRNRADTVWSDPWWVKRAFLHILGATRVAIEVPQKPLVYCVVLLGGHASSLVDPVLQLGHGALPLSHPLWSRPGHEAPPQHNVLLLLPAVLRGASPPLRGRCCPIHLDAVLDERRGPDLFSPSILTFSLSSVIIFSLLIGAGGGGWGCLKAVDPVGLRVWGGVTDSIIVCLCVWCLGHHSVVWIHCGVYSVNRAPPACKTQRDPLAPLPHRPPSHTSPAGGDKQRK